MIEKIKYEWVIGINGKYHVMNKLLGKTGYIPQRNKKVLKSSVGMNFDDQVIKL